MPAMTAVQTVRIPWKSENDKRRWIPFTFTCCFSSWFPSSCWCGSDLGVLDFTKEGLGSWPSSFQSLSFRGNNQLIICADSYEIVWFLVFFGLWLRANFQLIFWFQAGVQGNPSPHFYRKQNEFQRHIIRTPSHHCWNLVHIAFL